jgi:hypothetical protein
MNTPLFIASQQFGPADEERWLQYFDWAKIPNLLEIVSLDGILCPHVITEFTEEDWRHLVCEDFRLDYFYDLDYLMQRVRDVSRRNILGIYRNPDAHISTPPAPGDFGFLGYDLIEEQTQISALTNCGGFPNAFQNDELNQFGLVESFERGKRIGRLLTEHYPNEPHAKCELYAIWRLRELQQ